MPGDTPSQGELTIAFGPKLDYGTIHHAVHVHPSCLPVPASPCVALMVASSAKRSKSRAATAHREIGFGRREAVARRVWPS